MNWRRLGPAKIRDNGRHFHVFSDHSYQELLVCYIQIIYIILKFDFVWVSALVVDQTFVFNSGSCWPKCWKMMKSFKKYKIWNFESKTFPFHIFFKNLFFWKCLCFWLWTKRRCLQHNLKNCRFFEFSWKYGDWHWLILKFTIEELHLKEILKLNYKMRWSALRVPGGNQVDGLPPARHRAGSYSLEE